MHTEPLPPLTIHAYPPRRLWAELFGDGSRRHGAAPLTDARRRSLDAMIGAVESFYQVEARLWDIPDRAEVMPGVSWCVTRKPFDAVDVALPPDVTPAEVASVVAAARAVGVKSLRPRIEGGAPLPDAAYVMSRMLPPCAAPAPSSPELRVALGDCPEGDGADYVIRRRRGIVMLADSSSIAEGVAADIDTVLASGSPLTLLTNSRQLAAQIPAMTHEPGQLTIILLADAAEVADAVALARPQLIIASGEDSRASAAAMAVDATLLLSPVPRVDCARSLLSLCTPVIPIHIFTRTLAVIDPLTAR